MKIEYNGVCDKGLVRQINQDRLYMKSKGNSGMFVIADGMGGHSNGEKASEHIVSEIRKWYENFDELRYNGKFDNIVYEIQMVLQQANKYIYDNYSKISTCGSTVVLLFSLYDMYALLWAGDSRIYFYKGFTFKQLSDDDVWENQLEIRKNLKKSQIRENINCGKLVNAIGIDELAKINIRTDRMKKGTRFLLCSDGLYKMCDDSEIKKMMKNYTGNIGGDIKMRDYLQNVYNKGAKDNVSFIVTLYM